MTKYLYSNNATTTLGSSLSSSATAMTVTTGTGNLFPSPVSGQYFSVTLLAAGSSVAVPNEIVYCTSRTGDTFTIVRGQEGTTALGWNVGDMVSNDVTAGYLNQVAQITDVQAQTGNFADDTGTANAGVIALSPIPINLAALFGAPIRVNKIDTANTGAYTLNVNGLGAQPVTIANVGNISAGQLAAQHIFEVIWDGVSFELLSPPALIENSGLAQMPANTVKANLTGASAVPQDATLISLLSALGGGSALLAANGYLSIPVIISGALAQALLQWTFVSAPTFVSGHGSKSFTWPISFPNAISQAFSAGFGLNTAGGAIASSVTSTSTAGGVLEMDVFVNSVSPAAGAGATAWAIGY